MIDMEDHLSGRTDRARKDIIPWLSDKKRLGGARLLEIGSGTGASTVAFAEQGADVTALDVDDASLSVAQVRCEAYGLRNIRFVVGNASTLSDLFETNQFDLIVFYASLEHMTHHERVLAIAGSWQILRPGGFWSIVESPNRLWYYDSHTSLLPFYHWLPDEVALSYIKFSPRELMREGFGPGGTESAVRLARSGRGVSYHELELALDEITRLHVVSSLSSYRRRRNPITFMYWLMQERRFEAVLKRAAPPGVAGAFFNPNLDLMIRKV